MRKLHKLKFVLFDFDGVLVDSTNLHVFSTIKAIEKTIKIPLTPKQKMKIENSIKTHIGQPFEEILNEIEEILNIRIKNVDKIKLVKRRIFLENLNRIKTLPCVYNTLSYLRRKKLQTGVASFASRLTLNRTLECKNLKKYFEIIVGIEDLHSLQKSKELLYHLAISRMGYQPREGILIGDTPIDIFSGGKIGMLPIGVTTGVYSKKHLLKAGAYKVFDNLCEFLSWIKIITIRWEARRNK